MMPTLVEFPSAYGPVVVEVDETVARENGWDLLGNESGTIHKSERSFEEAIDRMKPVAELVLRRLHNLSQAPAEIELEFGINLSVNAGVVLAKAAVEANYKVTLKWKVQNGQP